MKTPNKKVFEQWENAHKAIRDNDGDTGEEEVKKMRTHKGRSTQLTYENIEAFVKAERQAEKARKAQSRKDKKKKKKKKKNSKE